MTRRILILSASVGSGHVRAAQAVQLALEQMCPDAVIANIDVLDFANTAFRRIYGRSYFDLVSAAPHLVGYLYDRLDRPLATTGRQFDRVRLGLQRLNLRRLADLLVSGRWDLAINTHFLPAEIVATLRLMGRIEFPQVTVTTDFDTHRLWVNQPCEHYFTATEEGRLNLAMAGVPDGDITATGIPIHPAFARNPDRSECRLRHGLSADGPVVLQLAGGGGFGPVEEIHRRLLDTATPLELVTIAGRNMALRERLEAIRCPRQHRRRVLGFTTDIDQFMAAADVIVTKPGGLTSSEALARGLPMLIVDPIPGQESRNSDCLLENGAALKANNLASLAHKLDSLLLDSARLERMRSAARRLARPRAAFEVGERALRLLGNMQPQRQQQFRMRAETALAR